MTSWDQPGADVRAAMKAAEAEGEGPFQPFVMTPLGPFNDADGTWCCGLHCGKPCPFQLKIKPGGKLRE